MLRSRFKQGAGNVNRYSVRVYVIMLETILVTNYGLYKFDFVWNKLLDESWLNNSR